jgi:hypothetical protein
MKVKEFKQIIENVPCFKARFKLIKLPKGLKDNSTTQGDYYLYNDDLMIPEIYHSKVLSINYSIFKFIEYVKVKQSSTYPHRYDVIGKFKKIN